VVRGIVDQLADGLEHLGWSVNELLERSGLPIGRSALQRKLRGQLRLNVDEAEVLATTMKITLVWPQTRKARRSA
jgi:ribosome-binding protein aMBF1 (putative translation factor)